MKQETRYDVKLKLTDEAKKYFEMYATSDIDLDEKIHDLITDNLWDFIDFDYEREPYTDQELEEIRADEELDRIRG